MEFAEVVRKRRMVRHFRPDPIDPERVERIIRAARRAPSAGYTQGQSLVVVTDEVIRREVGRLVGEEDYVARFGHRWISEAPLQVVVCVSERAYHRRYQEPDKLRDDGTEIEWPVPYWWVDAGMTAMLVLLAAVDEGLAAAYAGVPDVQGLRDLLGIPDEVTPVGVIPIGYPDSDIPSPSLKRGRRPLEEFAHRERW